jgi:hypothetical protein
MSFAKYFLMLFFNIIAVKIDFSIFQWASLTWSYIFNKFYAMAAELMLALNQQSILIAYIKSFVAVIAPS